MEAGAADYAKIRLAAEGAAACLSPSTLSEEMRGFLSVWPLLADSVEKVGSGQRCFSKAPKSSELDAATRNPGQPHFRTTAQISTLVTHFS
ncbi:hypothetical protein D9M70_649300 [compost metagenome]